MRDEYIRLVTIENISCILMLVGLLRRVQNYFLFFGEVQTMC